VLSEDECALAGGGFRRDAGQVDLKGRFPWIENLPEEHRLDVNRHGILGQGLFRFEGGRDDPNIDPVSNFLNNRNNKKQSGSFQPGKVSEAQDNRSLPLICDLGGGGKNNRTGKPSRRCNEWGRKDFTTQTGIKQPKCGN
jgi:hypothetical protein